MQEKKYVDKGNSSINSMKDENAEFSIISTLIKQNELWGGVSDILSEDVFINTTNRVVFGCVKGVLDANGVADIHALYDYHQKHPSRECKLELYDFMSYNETNPIAFSQNVARIVDYYKHRKVWELSCRLSLMTQDHTEDIDDVVEKTIVNLKNIGNEGREDTLLTMEDVARESMKIVEENQRGGARALRTGFITFDDRFMLRPTTLTIIAAFSSVGKSALALNIAENVAVNGYGVAYYTKEMANVELFNRMVAFRAKTSANQLTNARLDEVSLQDYKYAVEQIKRLPIYFDQGATMTFEKTIRSIRDVVKRRSVKLVIIDYLQIFAQTKEGGEESSLGYMARELKNVAKDLEICVIALSQISRPAKANDKSVLHPRMRGLRGSGQLEESADSVILIDRPEVFQGENVPFEGEFASVPTDRKAVLIVSKGRGTGTGAELVGFEGKYTRYFDIDRTTFEPLVKPNIPIHTQLDMISEITVGVPIQPITNETLPF